jgi:hypothetical protein
MTERGRIAAEVRDARAGVTPQRERPLGKALRTRTRPAVEVEYRWTVPWARRGDDKWRTYWRRYRTVAIARQMIERAHVKHTVMEFRIKGTRV